jgi:EmrB/QacA subfamily drug resistance transporter
MKPSILENPMQRITLIMILLNAFATPVMLSAVNVAIPFIADDLSVNAVLLCWIPMAYLMASAMFVLIFGRIADMLGRKKIFLIGTTSVIVTSLIATLVDSGITLIAVRFLQGISAAMLYATQVAIISSIFPPAKRGYAIGLTVSAIYLGLTIGPLIGGYAVDLYGWRASFVVHLPLAMIALAIGILYVKDEWLSDVRGSFDLFGAILYMLSILVLCFGVSYLPSVLSSILIFFSLFGFIFFFLFERKHIHPIFDTTLFFTNRVFTFSCLASLIIYTATFANVVQINLYLQYLKGFSATAAGMIVMCQPITMAIFSPIAGRLSDKFEPKYLSTVGMAVTCCGLIMLSNLEIHSELNYLILSLVITGFGFSLFSPPNVNAIMGSVEKKFYGSATGAMATMRVIGQMFSMVLVTLIFALIIGSVDINKENYGALEDAIRIIFSISAILCIPGLYLSMARGNFIRT